MKQIMVWDLPTRIFHWSLVGAFILAYVTEDDWLTVHVWAGYVVLALLVFRLAWGFLGNEYARFSSFVCKPKTSLAYIKVQIKGDGRRYLGHNPAGALMIVLLLLALLGVFVSGLVVYAADQNAGLLAIWVGPAYEDLFEEIHEGAVNFTVILIIGHIAGVIAESLIHKENLTRAMWHGHKRADD